MSRTLTAMFDSRADAEAAREALLAASIDADDVQIHDRASSGYSDTEYSTTENKGFWASLRDMFLPDEDRYTYEEGVRRGGVVLTAEVDEDDVDEAESILDRAKSVDLDQRTAEWRSSGWSNPAPSAGILTGGGSPSTNPGAWDASGASETFSTGRAVDGGIDRDRLPRDTATDEERIPIVEEQVRIGKREVDRGGVRVRSYIVEEPVAEDVTLRQEHVSVERRPVDLPLSAAADAFRERTIEVTEHGEEAVVAKEARVREELVVRKDVDQRTEHVGDTVRRTEVEVEDTRDGARTAPDTPAVRSDR